MNKFKEIKSLLSNKEVVQRYLGIPVKSNSTGNWYLSPFRSEKTASFCASDKGIHDFGDSSHYDIFSFVKKYFKTDNKTALDILAKDFNLNIGNEYETNKTIEYLKAKREAEKKAKERVDNWFTSKFNEICDNIIINKKCIENAKIHLNFEALEYLYKEQVLLELEFDTFFNTKEEKKAKLYLQYKEEEENDKRGDTSNYR